jgi:hypothetical protein
MVTLSIGRRLGAAARWFAIVTVFMATAELFARVDDARKWGAPLFSPYTHDRLLQQDSLGFFRGRPNYRYQKWRMNNVGFRGSDIEPMPARGVTRVAVMGASETFGLYESEGAEYPARMQTLLDSLAPGRFEVINAGLFGMSLSGMSMYFQRVILPAHPEILLVYPTPPFYLEERPPPVVYTPPRYTPPRLVRVGLWAFPPDFFDSRIGEKGREVLKSLIPDVAVTAVREWQLDRERSAHPADWVWPSVPADRMAILKQHFERLVTCVQSAGVKMVLVTHTNRFVGAPVDTLGPDRRHLVNDMSQYWPEASKSVLVAIDSVANAVVRQVAAEHGVSVAEAEGRIPPTSRYFADYDHFTDAGADRMARITSATVMQMSSGATAQLPPQRVTCR